MKRHEAMQCLINHLRKDFVTRGFKPPRIDTFQRQIRAHKLLLDVHDGFVPVAALFTELLRMGPSGR